MQIPGWHHLTTFLFNLLLTRNPEALIEGQRKEAPVGLCGHVELPAPGERTIAITVLRQQALLNVCRAIDTEFSQQISF
jgi:hypothetical protein